LVLFVTPVMIMHQYFRECCVPVLCSKKNVVLPSGIVAKWYRPQWRQGRSRLKVNDHR
jgi:hypothetical protein